VDDKGKVLLAKGAELNDEALDPCRARYWGEIRLVARPGVADQGAAQLSGCSTDLEELVRTREEHFRREDRAPCHAATSCRRA
jgi:hypothetical protein